ncbi:MAG: copper amine oxidase N-terminal domain-containing protein, partial [Lachnospiraceae bacterium]|nr:copper amine oxidase N-terminal domain-containing protein [Lachnospiraceae bacterium]
RTKPELFAGAGMSAGPDNTTLFTDPDADLSEFGPIPVYQSRGERDTLCPSTVEGINRRLLNMSDRDFWLKVNGCEMLPAVIKIDGRNNYMVYRGTKADVVYRDVKWRGHGQTIDDAEQMWRQLFSGVCRNENNEVVMGEPIDPLKTDKAVILADGAGNVFVNSEKKALTKAPYELLQYMEVPETMLERMPELKDKKNVPSYGPFLYVAAEDVASLFGFEAEYSYEGQRVILKKEGCRIQISAGNVASTVNGVIKNLERQAEFKDGTLYVPVRSIAEYLKKIVIMQDGVWYITDHAGEMTADFAAFLKGYLA